MGQRGRGCGGTDESMEHKGLILHVVAVYLLRFTGDSESISCVSFSFSKFVPYFSFVHLHPLFSLASYSFLTHFLAVVSSGILLFMYVRNDILSVRRPAFHFIAALVVGSSAFSSFNFARQHSFDISQERWRIFEGEKSVYWNEWEYALRNRVRFVVREGVM